MTKSVLSWGLGLQSTMLAVMSTLGELPPLDMIITADLGFEQQATYDVMEYYTDWLRKRGQNVVILDTGNIDKQGADEHIHIPFFTETGAPLRRQCTSKFKIRPIRRHIREWLGYPASEPPHPPATSVEQWIGFTIDEYTRMKTSGVKFITNRFPLIEKRIHRADCPAYFAKHSLPEPTKSACICCPYRKASEWQEMKINTPGEFDAACDFDERNRNNPLARRKGSTADKLYIWKDAIPLRMADLPSAAARERKPNNVQTSMFMPCESGYCFI